MARSSRSSPPSALFRPLTLRGLTLDNRIVLGPMDQYSAVDGCATDWHLMHYGRFAVSGLGLVVTESAHVERRGRITRGCLGLYSDENEAALDRMFRFCSRFGSAKLGVQIGHSGRKGSTRLPSDGGARSTAPEFLGADEEPWTTDGATSQPRAPGWPSPVMLDEAGMKRVLDAHVEAARRAARIGSQYLELVMGHGYLLHQFLSPLVNDRTDGFGGTLPDRLRYPVEVFKAVRAAWPAERPLGARISATDWVAGGWDPDQSVVLCRLLKECGCDIVAVSSGGLSLDQEIVVGEGHQVEFSAQIRRDAGLPTIATGMIFDPLHADRVISEGDADAVALARGLLVDPNWAWGAAAALDEAVSYPRQFIRGYRSRWHRERLAARHRRSPAPPT